MGALAWSSTVLAQTIRQTLESSGVPFAENVPVDGYQADFVFETPDGKQHVLEAKPWEPTRPDLARAKKLASDLKTLPLEGGYVVVPRLESEQPSKGVVSVKGLRALLKAAAAGTSPAPRSSSLPATRQQRIVFAAMPFAPKYDDVFFVAIRGAAKSARTAAKRVDKEDYAGDVVERIRQRIAAAAAVIVDLSESRPNVLYEMGFAQACNRPVVPICSTPVDEIPFDVRNLNILLYEPGQTTALRPRLARRLRAVLVE